jgi:hypothetical protein
MIFRRPFKMAASIVYVASDTFVTGRAAQEPSASTTLSLRYPQNSFLSAAAVRKLGISPSKVLASLGVARQENSQVVGVFFAHTTEFERFDAMLWTLHLRCA